MPSVVLANALLRVAEGVQENVIVGHRLLNQLNEQKGFRRIDHRMHSLLKGLHGIESSESSTDKDHYRVAALGHGHSLQGQEAFVFLKGAPAKYIFKDHHVIRCLRKLVEELSMIGRGVHLVAELIE